MKNDLHTERHQKTAASVSVKEKTRLRSIRERYTPTHLRRKRLSRKERLILLIPAFAAVLAVVVAMLTLDRSASYELKDTAYQYYGGSTAMIENGTLKRRSDGVSLLVQGNHSAETTLPIYASNNREVVIPTDMLYFAPRSGGCERLVYFSEVECKTNGTIVVRRENKSVNPEQGFLYDGKDFYLFLEPVVLSFNGYTMELPAMSYVEAVYGGHMMVFNYETKEFFIESSDGTGTAQPSSGDYVLSLLGDSMTLHDGTKSLLATRADLFDPLI